MRKTLIVFLFFGAVWGIFFCPQNLDAPQELISGMIEDLGSWVDNFFAALIGLVLFLILGILWVIFWLAGLLKLQYFLFGAVYIGLYGLLFIGLTRLFQRLLGVRQ